MPLGTGSPVPDKVMKIDTLFQTKKRETQFTFESEKACLSERAAGPEGEQQQPSFAVRFWQQNSNPSRAPELEWQTVDPVPDRNADL